MSSYDDQRPPKTPPHISIGDLRAVSGMTLAKVCEEVEAVTHRPFTRGALSAIENGHRGASAPILRALEVVYGLRPNALVTDYAPRPRDLADAS